MANMEKEDGERFRQLPIYFFFNTNRYKEFDCNNRTTTNNDESFDIVECSSDSTEPAETAVFTGSDDETRGGSDSLPEGSLESSFSARSIYKGSHTSSSLSATNSVANSTNYSFSSSTVDHSRHGGKKIIIDTGSPKDRFSQERETLCSEDVRHTQKEVCHRGTTANFRLPPPQQISTNLPLQDGRLEYSKRIITTRRLDDIHRPEISLPASGNKSEASTTSDVSVEGSIHPLHDTSVRSQYCPSRIFEIDASSGPIGSTNGSENCLLFGRHSDPCEVTRRSHSSHSIVGVSANRTGIRDQLGEISINPDTEINFLGDRDRFNQDVSITTRREDPEDSQLLSKIDQLPTVEKVQNQGASKLLGDTEFNERMFRPRENVHTFPTQGLNESLGQGLDNRSVPTLSGSKRGIAVVARALAVSQWSTNSTAKDSAISSTDGCQQSWLGRSTVSTESVSNVCSRTLGSQGSSQVQQCEGDDSRCAISRTLPTKVGSVDQTSRQIATDRIRQYDHSKHHSAERKHDNLTEQTGNKIMEDHSAISISNNCSISSRSTKRDCGRSESYSPNLFDRESAAPRNFRSHRPELRSTSSRPLCQSFQPPTSKIRELEGSPSVLAGRCFQSRLDSTGRSISEPSTCSDRKMSEQDHPRQSNDGAHRPSVASPTMVADTAPIGQDIAHSITIPPKSFYGPKRAGTVSRVDNSRVVFIRRQLKGRGFSDHAIDTVLESWKDARDYDSAWNCWVAWATQNRNSLGSFDTTAEANFVSDMRLERQWRANTAITMCSRIRATIEVANGKTTGTAFRRGLCRSLPVTSEQTEVTFDIQQVERHLLEAGAAIDKPMKVLRSHVLTLLSLYFGCRSSDKARVLRDVGIQLTPVCRIRFWNTKEMRSITRLRQPLWTQWFEIKSNPKPALDLVSHLKAYIDRTPQVHQDIPVILDGKSRLCTGLFVSLTLTEGKASSLGAERLANLLVEVLSKAGVDTTHFKGHSARGAVASALIKSGCSLTEVLERCRWSGIQTLAKHYLKPIDG